MNADRFLAFADTLRAHAQSSGHDLNASNLFVHNILMRALAHEERDEPPPMTHDAIATELKQLNLLS